ncbi:hypothetical protein GCM10009624_27030 [Gordonia sinesedis]
MRVSEKVAKRKYAAKALDELRAELIRSGDEDAHPFPHQLFNLLSYLLDEVDRLDAQVSVLRQRA